MRLFIQSIRFTVVGVLSTSLYYLFALFFQKLFVDNTVTASVLAYCLSAVFSFSAHKQYTFVESTGGLKGEVIKFMIVTTIGLMLAALIPFILSHCCSEYIYLITAFVIPAVTFVLMKFVVFK